MEAVREIKDGCQRGEDEATKGMRQSAKGLANEEIKRKASWLP